MVPIQPFDAFKLGSFLDLLMRTKDRTTGRGFTDVEPAVQVTPVPACMPGLLLNVSASALTVW